MKKILKLLATVALGGTVMTPNILLTNTTTNKISWFTNDIELLMQPIVQETNYYCVPASIQMIFKYFNVNLGPYSQHQIFKDLDGNDNGVVVNELVADYLNDHIPMSTNYFMSVLPDDFGIYLLEKIIFQDYVYNSLSAAHPLIIGFDTSPTDGHVYTIFGIKLNAENPDLTQYLYIDPADASRSYFMGNELAAIFKDGGEIVGNSHLPR